VKLPYRTEQESTEHEIPSGTGADEARAGCQAEAGQGYEEGREESGTARARRILIQPLAGLGRPRKISEAQHRDNLDRLARELSYMEEVHLRGLVDLCLGYAGKVSLSKGGIAPACPDPAMVKSWAKALQAPPVQASDYPASVLRSAMGRRAFDQGMGVELLRMARKFGPPPGSYSLVAMRDQAEANRRRRKAYREAIEAGAGLTPSQEAELKAWHDDALIVEQLVAEGDERREARAAAQGEAA
jgi:hypothetical protein